MEQWSVRDDRPSYYRPAEDSHAAWLVPALAVALIAAVAAGAYWWQVRGHKAWMAFTGSPPPEATAPSPAAAPVAAAAPQPQPEVRHPLPAPEPQVAAEPLPPLDTSDAMAGRKLADLVGGKAFAELVLPLHLVRRIVATVDNLPRETAPRRLMPLKAVPGAFATKGSGEEAVLDAANFKRYAPYVRVLESVDARALVSTYVRTYPLFQKAYRELGYPKGNFNDRLVEAIDDMLAAPEIGAPIRLMRPKVLYEFSDPDLETRSAGQKILIRMGSANASRVKAKLREIRRELIAAGKRRPAHSSVE
jgi:hypothetical protein